MPNYAVASLFYPLKPSAKNTNLRFQTQSNSHDFRIEGMCHYTGDAYERIRVLRLGE